MVRSLPELPKGMHLLHEASRPGQHNLGGWVRSQLVTREA